MLSKAKQLLDHKSLCILYSSLVSPYLSYCAEVWGNNYKTTLHSLFILQKKAIWTILNAGYRDHTNAVFLQLKILKFADLVEFQTAQMMFRAKNNQLPGNILYIKIVRVCTTRKSFCISVWGVRLWNRLNLKLKECPSMKHLSIEKLFSRGSGMEVFDQHQVFTVYFLFYFVLFIYFFCLLFTALHGVMGLFVTWL